MTDDLRGTSFEAQMERVRFITGTKSLMELAGFLGIRQSAASDAKRRGVVPLEWLVALMRTKNANPEWILTGKGPSCFTGPPEPRQYKP